LGAIALSACGSGQRASGHASAATTSSAATAATQTPRAPAVPPALLKLRRMIDAALRSAGPQSGVLVYDLAADRQLFAARAEVMRPPASVEKLYTTVALLTALNPDTTFETDVLGAGHLGPGGVWSGDLYLRGGGDPTFGDETFNRIWEEGYGPTAVALVEQLAGAGIRSVSGHVFGDESLFDSLRGGPATGYAPDIPDFGGELAALTYDHGSSAPRLSPAAFAARQLARTLRANHIHALASRVTASTPPHARRLASVQSPRLSVLLRLMDTRSDDLFAEMLTKQLGVRFGNGGSIQSGAKVISSTVSTYGVSPQIIDGSGLSRSDRTSPQQVVQVLKAVWGTWIAQALNGDLPVVGVSGTTRRIAVGTPAQGRCTAKTGTLNYVTNLAGYCHARRGHQLAFAVFVDGPTNADALKLLSRMLGAIAGY
jgi:D-alanyl-D-alanine carboxypeptidase/D-alanyl-D-alanine-endopeptidase (penicillin-binding protein 4)